MSIVIKESLSSGQTVTSKEYGIDAADANALFIGSPVKIQTATGLIRPIVAADNESALFIGIVTGLRNTSGDVVASIPASTGGTAEVCVDPNVVIEIKLKAAANLAVTDQFKQYNFDFTIAGDATTGANNVRLDNTAANSNGGDDTHQLIVIGKHPDDAWGTNELRVHCVPALHKLKESVVAEDLG